MNKLNLVKIDDYGLEWTNRYWVNADRFEITKEELENAWVKDESAYLTVHCCELLSKLDKELREKHKLKLIVKDAYRSKELYDLVRDKRIAKLWKEETDKIFNTKNDYPHSSWNTLDVAFMYLNNDPFIMFKWNIQDRSDLVASRARYFYKDADDEEGKLIHKNRMFMQDMMSKYWFEGIDHEYWHFNLRK
jgi:D-alanyl-D-alanine dipeptidase